ncbi:MAG: mechanosensitive ion channel [Betaproteobacteria bacterium]|nr:mechanosensitive ion channel [Betaproteobacteria bacterium]
MFDLDAWRTAFVSTHGQLQLGFLAAAGLIAWLVARTVKSRLPADLQPGLARISAGSAQRLVFPIVFLALAWLVRAALAKSQPVPLLNVAIPLIGAFAIIRLALYLLRHMVPPSALLKASERLIAYGVWGLVALYLTGALPEILGAMEETGFSLGKQTVTLRQVIEAIFSAGITIFIALGLSRLIEQRLMRAESLDMSARVVIGKFVRALALVLAVLVAMPLVGIDLTLLSVFGGALGVGLGFGLQKIASNYVSGFIILLDRSVRLGDLVTVDGRHGIIASIKTRYTVLRGLDGTEAIIPNDTLITNTVVNHTYSDPVVSVRTLVTVGFDSDLDAALAILREAAAANSRVVANPEATAWLKQLGENGIELELTVWIRDAEQGQSSLRSELLLYIWRAFQARGISVPFPQREVRVLPTQNSDPARG